MPRVVIVVLSVCVTIIVLFSACDGRSLVEPLYNESKTIYTDDGIEFSVFHREDNVPDQEIIISVSGNGAVLFSNSSFDDHLSWYDYENDIVDRWYEIIAEYHQDSVHAYQFHWGVLYSVDDRATYEMIPKHEYAQTQNDTFVTILEELRNHS